MRLGSHESHLGAHKVSGLARTAPRRHERHPRAQNASGLARTAPRVRAPRMRAGTRANASSAPRMRARSHARNLRELKRSECERARTDAISRGKGHRRRRPECERARTNATSATSRALSRKRMCQNTCVLSAKNYDNKKPNLGAIVLSKRNNHF